MTSPLPRSNSDWATGDRKHSSCAPSRVPVCHPERCGLASRFFLVDFCAMLISTTPRADRYFSHVPQISHFFPAFFHKVPRQKTAISFFGGCNIFRAFCKRFSRFFTSPRIQLLGRLLTPCQSFPSCQNLLNVSRSLFGPFWCRIARRAPRRFCGMGGPLATCPGQNVVINGPWVDAATRTRRRRTGVQATAIFGLLDYDAPGKSRPPRAKRPR